MTTLVCTIHGPKEIEAMLWGLAKVSLVQIQDGRVTVPLYKSGARYRREPLPRERWQSALETAQLKAGDCEDLVAWRVAELWAAGERGARPECYSPRPGLIHCVVRRASGRRECPSRMLGMGGVG